MFVGCLGAKPVTAGDDVEVEVDSGANEIARLDGGYAAVTQSKFGWLRMIVYVYFKLAVCVC